MNIYDVFKGSYNFMKILGFFPLTIDFTPRRLGTSKTSSNDIIFFILSFIVSSFAAVANTYGKTFLTDADSRISRSGFLVWRVAIYSNAVALPTFCWIYRNRMNDILRSIHFVDQKVCKICKNFEKIILFYIFS